MVARKWHHKVEAPPLVGLVSVRKRQRARGHFGKASVDEGGGKCEQPRPKVRAGAVTVTKARPVGNGGVPRVVALILTQSFVASTA